MKFNWQDCVVTKEFGTKLVGLTRGHRRPTSVTLSRQELKYLMDSPLYLKNILGCLRDGIQDESR